MGVANEEICHEGRFISIHLITKFVCFFVAALGEEVSPSVLSELNLPMFGGGESSESADGPGDNSISAQPQLGTGPFVISEALPVIPAKILKRIWRCEFVDMTEFLKDNMEAERRRCLAESGSGTSSLATRPTRREVPDLMSWLYCFNLYAAAVCANIPTR